MFVFLKILHTYVSFSENFAYVLNGPLMHFNLFALDYGQISNKRRILRCSAFYREVSISAVFILI